MIPHNDDIMLSKLIELYYQEQQQTLKPSTYDRNHKVCVNIAKLLGNDVLVGSLNSGYIRK